MDDFKLNAAKIIAAQQKKSRAQSPDSVSNWDSSEPEEAVNNVSSEEEISIRSTRSQRDRKLALQGKQSKKKPATTSTPKKQEERTKTLSKGRTDLGSTGPNLRRGVNSFVDRHTTESVLEEPRGTVSRNSRTLKDEHPPHDFSAAVSAGDSTRGSPANVRPGQSRKGNQYDIPASPKDQKRRGSWDESDEDERIVMEELRGVMEGQGKDADGDNVDYGTKEASPGFKVKDASAKEGIRNKSKWSLRKKKSGDNSNRGYDNKALNVSQQFLITNTGDNETSVAYSVKDLSAGEEYAHETAEAALMRKEQADARYVYHFHQGSTHYFDTRNSQDEVYMSKIADKSERLVRRCVSEVFSTIRIAVDFFVILFLELVKFLIFRLIGAFLVGLVVIFGDFLLKPFLTSFFNSVCQPVSAACYNCSVALRTISFPLRDALVALCNPCAMLLRASRLVEVNWNNDRNKHTHYQEV